MSLKRRLQRAGGKPAAVTEGSLLRPASLQMEGRTAGCASCGAPVGAGVCFGAKLEAFYTAEETPPNVAEAASRRGGSVIVFGVCCGCLLNRSTPSKAENTE